MKNLFTITNDLYNKENYYVTAKFDYAGFTRTDYHENKPIFEAIQICEECIAEHPLSEIIIACTDTDEVIYERKATEGDLPKSTNVYTYNIIFDHLAELLKQEMDF